MGLVTQRVEVCVFLFARKRERRNNPSKFGANGKRWSILFTARTKAFSHTDRGRESEKAAALIFSTCSLWWSASNDIMLAQPSMCHLTPQLRVFAQRMKSLLLSLQENYFARRRRLAPRSPRRAVMKKRREGGRASERTDGTAPSSATQKGQKLKPPRARLHCLHILLILCLAHQQMYCREATVLQWSR